MPNVKSIIDAHNKKLLFPTTMNENRSCNCPQKETSLLNQKCLTPSIVYKATITSDLLQDTRKKNTSDFAKLY